MKVNLPGHSTYYIRARATGLAGTGEWSTWTEWMTPNHTPSPIAFVNPMAIDTVRYRNIQLPIRWTRSSDADGDTLTYFVRITGGMLDTLLSSRDTSTQLSSSRLVPGTSYAITASVSDGWDTVNATNTAMFVTTGTLLGIAEKWGGAPNSFFLEQNFPNPFNPSTIIRYTIPNAGLVTLTIHDILGRKVAVLVDEERGVGPHQVTFDGTALSNGIYYYTLNTDGFISTRNMLLVE